MAGTFPNAIRPPPRRCRVIVEPHTQGFTVTIPPRGFGCLLLFTLFSIAAAIFVTLSCYDRNLWGGPSTWVRFIIMLWLPVIILGLLTLIHARRRRVVLTVSGSRLRIEEYRPFLQIRQCEWQREQLFAICPGPDSKLLIFPRGRAPFSLGYTGPGLELEWLADTLRRGLQLGAEPPPPAEPQEGTAVEWPRDVAPTIWAPKVWAASEGAVAWDMWAGTALKFTGVAVFLLLLVGSAISLQFITLPWPALKAYRVPIGAALALIDAGIIGFLLHRVSERRYVEQLAEVSWSMNFDFQPTMMREEIGDYFSLRLFAVEKSAARYRMAGTVDGLFVDIFDYAFTVGSDRSAQTYQQTVMLLPAPDSGVPALELRARRSGELFVSPEIGFVPKSPNFPLLRRKLGKEGYARWLRDYARSRPTRESIQRFARRYAVRRYFRSAHLERAAGTSTQEADTGLPPDRAGTEEDIRALFNIERICYFANHPGWNIESDGRHLALWRSKRLVAAAKRPRFVSEALEVYRLLTEADAKAASASGQHNLPAPG